MRCSHRLNEARILLGTAGSDSDVRLQPKRSAGSNQHPEATQRLSRLIPIGHGDKTEMGRLMHYPEPFRPEFFDEDPRILPNHAHHLWQVVLL